MTNQRDTVTYAFDGSLNGAYAEAIERIREAEGRMSEEGERIDFLGATQEINAAGQLVEMSARYAAPSKGAVGRLNCRARLPATGGPKRETRNETEASVSVAGKA